MRAPALISVTLLLAACPARREPVVDVRPASTERAAAEPGASSVASAATPPTTPAPPPASSVEPPRPTATGPSRETLCEKAFFDLERSAAAPIDKCLGPRPSSNQPITINVRIDESGHIAETNWDVSTTTGYGEKAARCILAAVKAVPFEEPACSKEWLLVRRAAAQPPPSRLDSRF